MASTFCLARHHFKPGNAAECWETAMNALSDEAGWSAAIAASLDAGVFNHFVNPSSPQGPVCCVWEARDGIIPE